MNVLIYGATGMVGQGVLRECLRDPGIAKVLAVGRAATGVADPKLRELVRADLSRYDEAEPALAGYDACFFCLGVSSVGMNEADYTRVTYDLSLAIAQTLVRLDPGMTFIYVSGEGTDSSEQGRSMWARVKGRTENALLRLPFKAAYMFRPGMIQPLHGARSKTRLYQSIYSALGPLLSLARRLFPRQVLSTEQIGRAMIAVAREGAPKPVLRSADLYAIAGPARV